MCYTACASFESMLDMYRTELIMTGGPRARRVALTDDPCLQNMAAAAAALDKLHSTRS